MNIKKLINYLILVCKARLFKIKTPINIMWRITNKCNLKCSYCNIWKKKQKELTSKQIFKIIDEMSECNTQRIGFVGGECFLRDDFGQIIDYVKKKGIYVTLVSNGCLIPNNLEIIKKIDYLVISFDGTKKNHERGRYKGSFEKVIKSLEFCKKNKIKVLTNTVLNIHNLNDIDYILKTVKRYGFNCTFNVIQGYANCYPTNSNYKKAFNLLLKRKKQGFPIILSIKTMKFINKWPNFKIFYSKKKIKGFKCWAGNLIYNIDTDGKIASCDIMTNIKKNNPSCTKLGFKKAFKLVNKNGCKACTCTHVIEYNYMFSLNLNVIFSWINLIIKKKN
jgi:Fe-coproporphyrin III synthase